MMLSFRHLLRDPGLWVLVFGLACYAQLNFQDRSESFSSFTSNNILTRITSPDGPWKRGSLSGPRKATYDTP